MFRSHYARIAGNYLANVNEFVMFQYLTLICYGHFSFLEVLVCPRESGWENVIPTHILILFDLIHSNICLIPFDVFFVSDM